MTNTMKLKELSYPVSQYWVKIRLGSGYFLFFIVKKVSRIRKVRTFKFKERTASFRRLKL